MTLRTSVAMLALLSVPLTGIPAPHQLETHGHTAAEIVAHYIAARGGLDRERASGRLLDEVVWSTMAANGDVPMTTFAPPPVEWTPLRRMLTAIYEARTVPGDALAWYLAFRHDLSTTHVDTEAGMEFIGYQCLKTGDVATGIMLLEANLRDYLHSAASYFGLGRAYRTPHREREARREFRAALTIDPSFAPAAAALK